MPRGCCSRILNWRPNRPSKSCAPYQGNRARAWCSGPRAVSPVSSRPRCTSSSRSAREQPRAAPVHLELGAALGEASRNVEAIAALRRALQLAARIARRLASARGSARRQWRPERCGPGAGTLPEGGDPRPAPARGRGRAGGQRAAGGGRAAARAPAGTPDRRRRAAHAGGESPHGCAATRTPSSCSSGAWSSRRASTWRATTTPPC